jgi:HEAT repeat protein
LKDPEYGVQNEAISALGGLGSRAKPAVPELIRVAKNAEKDSVLARQALAALRQIAPEEAKKIPVPSSPQVILPGEVPPR